MGVLHPPGQDLQELLGDARMLKNHRADCVAVYRGRSYLAERGRASHSRAGIQHRRGAEDFLRSQDGEHRSPERRCTTELYALRDDDVEDCLRCPPRRKSKSVVPWGRPPASNAARWAPSPGRCHRSRPIRRQAQPGLPRHSRARRGCGSPWIRRVGAPPCAKSPVPHNLWSATGFRRFTIVRCDVGVVLEPTPAGGGSRSIARAASCVFSTSTGAADS